MQASSSSAPASQGCASSTATLKNGIEIILKESFPEIEEIDDVTDHTEGENPYM